MSLRERPGVVVRRLLNDAVDRIRSPWRRPEVLLITGNASTEKIEEVDRRLRFLFDHLGRDFMVIRTPSFELRDCFRFSGVVAADEAAIPMFVQKRIRLNWVVNLDYEKNPMDAYLLMQLGSALSHQPSNETLAMSRRRFNKRVMEIKSLGPRPVYLFGTGPSLAGAIDRSFSDGATVVCNTIVRDRELWAHLSPDFFVAGDAMYHFGHTEHARRFRVDALQRLRESKGKTFFVYPSLFDVIVRSEFQDVADILVPVPFVYHDDPIVDLGQSYGLPAPLANVLTVLLLPVGCTLGKDIRLWGFDGRSPADSGFWKNAAGQSYEKLMPELRQAHPAFFDTTVPAGRERQYVDKVHGQSLDDRLTEAEARGYRFSMLHASWTPTFQKRFREPDSPEGST